jgi:hypothetical protein
VRTRQVQLTAVVAAAALALGAFAVPALADGEEGEASGIAATLNVPLIGPVVIPQTPLVQQPPGGSDSAAGLAVPGVVSADALNAATGKEGGDVVSEASIVGLSALSAVPGALTTADVLAASCVGDEGTTTVLNANVLGTNIAVPVPPNTGINVPGVAGATVNEQTPSENGITVRAVHIFSPLLGDLVLTEVTCTGADVAAANVTSGTPNLAG